MECGHGVQRALLQAVASDDTVELAGLSAPPAAPLSAAPPPAPWQRSQEAHLLLTLLGAYLLFFAQVTSMRCGSRAAIRLAQRLRLL